MRDHIFASDFDLSARYLPAAGGDEYGNKSRRSSLQPQIGKIPADGAKFGGVSSPSRDNSRRVSLVPNGKLRGDRLKAHSRSDVKRVPLGASVDTTALQRSGSQPLFVVNGGRMAEKFEHQSTIGQIEQLRRRTVQKLNKHPARRVNMVALPRTIGDNNDSGGYCTLQSSKDGYSSIKANDSYITKQSNDDGYGICESNANGYSKMNGVENKLVSYKCRGNRFTQSALNLVGPSDEYLSHARSSDAVVHYNVLRYISQEINCPEPTKTDAAIESGPHKMRYRKRNDDPVGGRSPESSQPLYMTHESSRTEKIIRNKLLKRNTYSDLSYRLLQFQRFANPTERRGAAAPATDGTPSSEHETEIDPIYLALKEATSKYGCSSGRSGTASRRGSSAALVSSLDGTASPNPKNLSKVSLLDSGYGETYNGSMTHRKFIGSTPQLYERKTSLSAIHQAAQISPAASTSTALAGAMTANGGNEPAGSRRRPKLNQKMKSLSLDCAETVPVHPISMFDKEVGHMTHDSRASTDSLTATLPHLLLRARLANSLDDKVSHICTHDYIVKQPPGHDDHGASLHIGDRLCVVDNGDPDWLHGFKITDVSKQFLTFPKTCVAQLEPSEQPMKLVQNINIVENRLRLYRDQVVFAQPDSMCQDNSVVIRTEHNAFAHCHVKYLALL